MKCLSAGKTAYPALGARRHKTPSARRPAHQIGLSFGAICPERGTGAAVAMPNADTQAMQHHLDEIAHSLAPKAQPTVVLDQAGWHTTGKLQIPENLSLLPLPPKSPALNPVRNVWQFLRQNKLSNRIFGSYEAILTAACEPGTAFSPTRIASP